MDGGYLICIQSACPGLRKRIQSGGFRERGEAARVQSCHPIETKLHTLRACSATSWLPSLFVCPEDIFLNIVRVDMCILVPLPTEARGFSGSHKLELQEVLSLLAHIDSIRLVPPAKSGACSYLRSHPFRTPTPTNTFHHSQSLPLLAGYLPSAKLISHL